MNTALRVVAVVATTVGVLVGSGVAQADTTLTPVPVACPQDVIDYATSTGAYATPAPEATPTTVDAGTQVVAVTVPNDPRTWPDRIAYYCQRWADANGVTDVTYPGA